MWLGKLNLHFIDDSSMISLDSVLFLMKYDQKKGGEEMALEGIKQVTETEALVRQRKAEALAQAKKTVADARRAGEEALASARAQAESQAKLFLQEAEKKASVHTEQVVEETKRSCEALRQSAEGRMKDAAALIVRRVVNV